MKEFFLILFFAESVLLTPQPVDIEGEVTLQLAEPVSAITSGANVRIDVTGNIVDTVDLSNAVAVLDYLAQRYPDGSVTATLTTDRGEKTILERVSGSTSGEKAELVVSSSSGVQTDIDFSELRIASTKPLRAVTVTWQNHAK
jgi:hypothetical protein